MSIKSFTPKEPLPWLLEKGWPELWRVRLTDRQDLREKTQWCRDSVACDQWGRNLSGVVFYFRYLDDATAFWLRWKGSE